MRLRLGRPPVAGFEAAADVANGISDAKRRTWSGAGSPAQKQSLAHVLENMWLKATPLGLGFHLFSGVQVMASNREFTDLLGLAPKAFEVDACALGWPAQAPGERALPDVEQAVRWLA